MESPQGQRWSSPPVAAQSPAGDDRDETAADEPAHDPAADGSGGSEVASAHQPDGHGGGEHGDGRQAANTDAVAQSRVTSVEAHPAPDGAGQPGSAGDGHAADEDDWWSDPDEPAPVAQWEVQREVQREGHPLVAPNWWDDPDDDRPFEHMVEYEPQMRVLPDGSVVYEEVAEEPVEEHTSPSTMLALGVIGSTMLLLLALAIGTLLAARSNGGLNPQRNKAVGACHQYVQVRIGATTPSNMTTDFSEGEGYGPWRIQGTVDGTAQDGKPVNARYNCVVDANGDHSTWHLTKLEMF